MGNVKLYKGMAKVCLILAIPSMQHKVYVLQIKNPNFNCNSSRSSTLPRPYEAFTPRNVINK